MQIYKYKIQNLARQGRATTGMVSKIARQGRATTILVMLLGCVTLYSGDFPIFRGNAQRDGYQREYYEPKGTMTPDWVYQFQGRCISQPVYYRGRVYQMTAEGGITSINGMTGEVVWDDFIDAEIYATPAVSSGVLYVPSRNGNIYAYNIDLVEEMVKNGYSAEWSWKFQTGGSDSASPLVLGKKLYSARAHPHKDSYCLDLTAREMAWNYNTGQYIFSSPSFDGQSFYIGSNNGKYFKLKEASQGLSATKIWEIQTAGNIYFSCLALNNGLGYGIPGSYEKRLFIYDLESGNTAWQSPALDNDPIFTSSPAIDEMNYYVIFSSDTNSNDDSNRLEQHIICYDKISRAEKWRKKLGDIPAANQSYLASPVAANGCVVAVSGNGILYILNRDTGAELAKTQLDGDIISSPIIADGRVFTATMKGKLYSFSGEKYVSLVYPQSETLVKSAPVPVSGLVKDSGFSSFAVYWSTAETGAWVLFSSGSSIPQNNIYGYLDSQDKTDGRYFIKLKVNDESGKYSITDFLLDGLPQPPVLVSVADYPSDQGDKLLLSWTLSADDGANNNDVTGYRLYSSSVSGSYGGAYTPVSRGTTFYTVPSLTPGVTYYYRISAVDNNSESVSSQELGAFPVDNLPPSIPAGASASGQDGRVVLSWQENAEPDRAGYKIYFSSVSGIEPVLLAQTVTGYYLHPGLVNLVTYYYRISCFDVNANEGGKSSLLTIYPRDFTSPGIVTAITALTSAGSQSIELAWVNTGDDVTTGDITGGGFKVRYSSFSSNLSAYSEVTVSTGMLYAGNEMRFILGGLGISTTYYLSLAIFDDYGNTGSFSAVLSTVSAGDYIPPAPPSNFSVSDYPEDFGDKLSLSWTVSSDDGQNAGDVKEYSVSYSSENYPGQVSGQITTVFGTTFYIAAGLNPETTYYFALSAFDGYNYSAVVLSSGITESNWKAVSISSDTEISDKGIKIGIEKGSLSQEDFIVVSLVEPSVLAVGVDENTIPVGQPVNIKFYRSDTELIKPLTVSMPVSGAGVSFFGAKRYAPQDIKKLRVYYFDAQKNRWRINNSSKLSEDGNYVTCRVTKLAMLVVMELIPSGQILSEETVYTYPNPARGEKLYFKFKLNYDSSVEVKVFNIAGEEIKTLSKENLPAGLVSEIEWDISGIASGIYIYKVEAKTAAGNKTVTKKLGIVK